MKQALFRLRALVFSRLSAVRTVRSRGGVPFRARTRGAAPLTRAASTMAGVALALFCTFLLALPTTAYGANLTVNIEPSGAGIVTADGTPMTPGVQMWFEDDAVVTLIGVPDTNFVFGVWEGNVANPFSMMTTVVMDADKDVTAVFWATYTLTVAAAPESAGSVSCTPDRPRHVEGAVVVLTATSSTGFQFSRWTGSVEGVPNVSANPVRITMTANKSVTAVFLPIAPSTPVPANGATGVPVCTTLSWRGNPVDDNRLVNGGFERGNSTGWTCLSGSETEPTDWTVNSGSTTGSFGNGKPAAGSYFAQNSFDGTAGVSDELFQEVQINTGFLSVSLSWLERSQWDLASGGAAQPRHHEVRLQPAGGGSLLATLYSATLNPGTAGDTGYVSHSVDLLEAAPGILGQYVRISFLGIRSRDSHRPAQFDLDGVSLIGGAALPTTYDVYLGTDTGAMLAVCTGARTYIFGPGSLNPATKYYWQVRAKNDYGETPSPIWSFTTSSRGDLVFLESPQGGWVEEGQLLELHVTVSGAASPLYQWFKDGEPLPGGTESEYSIPAVTDEDAGWYSCRVRDESIDVYDESPRALIVVFSAGTLPTASVAGLCIAALVSVALGAVLIWCRRRPMPS